MPLAEFFDILVSWALLYLSWIKPLGGGGGGGGINMTPPREGGAIIAGWIYWLLLLGFYLFDLVECLLWFVGCGYYYESDKSGYISSRSSSARFVLEFIILIYYNIFKNSNNIMNQA